MWLLLILVAAAPSKTWLIRSARMEGAAVNVREAAAALRATAEGIADGQRLRDVARLHSQAFELNRRVSSALLAADQLDDPE